MRILLMRLIKLCDRPRSLMTEDSLKLFLVVCAILCLIPTMNGYVLLHEYEENLLQLSQFETNNTNLFSVVFALGVSLPILVHSVLLSVTFGVGKLFSRISLCVLIFLPDTVLLQRDFVVPNMVAMECFMHFRYLAIMMIIYHIVFSQVALPKMRSTMFCIFCGGSSIVLNTFSSYQLPYSEVLFILYLTFSGLGILSSFSVTRQLHNASTHKDQTNSRFLYILATSFVSLVYVVVSIITRYDDTGDHSAQCTAIAIMVQSTVALVVMLLDDQYMYKVDVFNKVKQVRSQCAVFVIKLSGFLCTPLSQERTLNQNVFIRLISHELRTPFNGMIMGLDEIEKEMKFRCCCARSVETLAEVRQSCEFSIGVLNNLISTKLLEKGIMQLDKTTLSVFSLILDNLTPFLLKQVHMFVSATCLV